MYLVLSRLSIRGEGGTVLRGTGEVSDVRNTNVFFFLIFLPVLLCTSLGAALLLLTGGLAARPLPLSLYYPFRGPLHTCCWPSRMWRKSRISVCPLPASSSCCSRPFPSPRSRYSSHA